MDRAECIEKIKSMYDISTRFAVSIYEDLEDRDLLNYYIENIEMYSDLSELLKTFYGV